MNDDPQNLKRELAELRGIVDRLEKQTIKIVQSFDGTDVQVTINGKRRKIETLAP